MQLESVKSLFQRAEAQELCRRYDVQSLGVFGSTARNTAKPESDVDLLVRFGQAKGLIEFITLEEQLARLLAHKVDLVTEAGLHPAFRAAVLRDLQIVYAA